MIVSLNDLEAIRPRVFPNPTSGLLKIVFPEYIQGLYEIKDLSGKILIRNICMVFDAYLEKADSPKVKFSKTI